MQLLIQHLNFLEYPLNIDIITCRKLLLQIINNNTILAEDRDKNPSENHSTSFCIL